MYNKPTQCLKDLKALILGLEVFFSFNLYKVEMI